MNQVDPLNVDPLDLVEPLNKVMKRIDLKSMSIKEIICLLSYKVISCDRIFEYQLLVWTCIQIIIQCKDHLDVK